MFRKAVTFLLFFLLAAGTLSVIHAQDDAGRGATTAVIISPIDGATISGQVVIVGSAGHPTQFAGYILEYKNQADPSEFSWLPIGQRVNQQITESTLGIWDTVNDARITEGTYQIRLRVFLADVNEAPVDFIVSNLQVLNVEPTALPSPVPDPPTATPFEGPTPTSEIFQPEGPTAIPSPAPLNNTENIDANTPTGEETGNTLSVNFDRLTDAFCNGVFITFIFFGLLAGYLFMRARLRPMTQQFMSQLRQNEDDDAYH